MNAYHDKARRKSNSAIQKLLQARIGGSHLLQVCAYCESQKRAKAHIYTCKYCPGAAFKGMGIEGYNYSSIARYCSTEAHCLSNRQHYTADAKKQLGCSRMMY